MSHDRKYETFRADSGDFNQNAALEWNLGCDLKKFPICRVAESEFTRMQAHGIALSAVSVKPVAQDGRPEPFFVGCVQPELVGSAGERFEFDARRALFHP